MGLNNFFKNRRCLLAAILLIFGVVIKGEGALAETGLYSASDIQVDVTGDIATLREQATAQAQRQALAQILAEIAPDANVAAFSLPDDSVVSSWVQDFSIDEEKIAANRYIGRFTFRFRAEPIAEFLTEQGVSFAQAQSTKIVIIPVIREEDGQTLLWDPANRYLAAWMQKRPSSTLLTYVIPSGAPADVAALSADAALAGDETKLAAFAKSYGARDFVVIEAALSPGAAADAKSLALTITLPKRAGGVLHDQITGPVDALDSLMGEGVARASALLQQAWRNAKLIDASQSGEIAIDVPLTGLEEWVKIKNALAKVEGLRGAKLVTLSRSLAEMELNYIGSEEQFALALSDQGLILENDESGHGILKLDLTASNLTPTTTLQ